MRCLRAAMPGPGENIRRTVARGRAERCHCNMGSLRWSCDGHDSIFLFWMQGARKRERRISMKRTLSGLLIAVLTLTLVLCFGAALAETAPEVAAEAVEAVETVEVAA